MKVFIVGNNGQLGNCFESTLRDRGTEVFGGDLPELDITSYESVISQIGEIRPDVIINCAAYNTVDAAEIEVTAAFAVNAIGPRNLGLAAKSMGAKFIHYSSDYVFDGRKLNEPYNEDDAPNPINEYGKSKLLGELFVKEVSKEHLIFRLSWVFGDGEQNFISKFLQWTKSSSLLKIANDEISVPTYTRMVVDVTLEALNRNLTGLYHLCSSGRASRYEWAEQIIRICQLDNIIEPISKDYFRLAAKRPTFSAMSNEKIMHDTGIAIPNWIDELERFFSYS